MGKKDFLDKYLGIAPFSDDEEIYYYVSSEIFVNGIIRPNELALWAGHVDYMEDQMEFKKGMKVLKAVDIDQSYVKTTESNKNRFPYQLSFSKNKDSVPLWKIYGGGFSSVMLILDAKKLWEFLNKTAKYSIITECIYDGTKEADWAIEFLNDKRNLDERRLPKNKKYVDFFEVFPHIFKDSHYMYEQEVRLFYELQDRDSNSEHYKYKLIDGVLKKFKEMHFDKDVLKALMVGPCVDKVYEVNRDSLYAILRANGFNHIRKDEILKSSIIVLR